MNSRASHEAVSVAVGTSPYPCRDQSHCKGIQCDRTPLRTTNGKTCEDIDDLVNQINSLVFQLETLKARNEDHAEMEVSLEYKLKLQADFETQKRERATHERKMSEICCDSPKTRSALCIQKWRQCKEDAMNSFDAREKIKIKSSNLAAQKHAQISEEADSIALISEQVLSALNPIGPDLERFLPGKREKLQLQITSIQAKSQVLKMVPTLETEHFNQMKFLRNAAICCMKNVDEYTQHVIRKLEEIELTTERERAMLEERERALQEERERARQEASQRQADEAKRIMEELSAIKSPDRPVEHPDVAVAPRSPNMNKAVSSPFHSPASYDEAVRLIDEFEREVGQLRHDPAHKMFVFNIKKTISVLCSQITSSSPSRLKSRFDVLVRFFQGHETPLQGSTACISLRGHPMATSLAWSCLFGSMVAQGEAQFATNKETALPFAAVVSGLISQGGKYYQVLFFAYMFVRCPLLAPFFPSVGQAQDPVTLLTRLGYRRLALSDDEEGEGPPAWESEEMFLLRCQGLARLYAAVMVVRPIEEKKWEQFSVGRLWRLLAWLTNTAPIQGVSAQIVKGLIEIGGNSLCEHYKDKYTNLLRAIHNKFSAEKDSISFNLTAFIEDILDKH